MGNTMIPVRAGVVSGLAGLATFLTIHALWITPIWNVAVIGVVIAGGGGVITARCYSLAHRLVPVRPLSWLVVFGVVAVTLVPCVVMTGLLPPLLEAENGQVVHPINVPWLVTGFFAYLLVPAAAVGATMGWLVTRRGSGAALFAGMGLLMAIGPGHNLPLFGAASGSQLFKAMVLTFAPMAVAAVVLTEAAALQTVRPMRASSS